MGRHVRSRRGVAASALAAAVLASFAVSGTAHADPGLHPAPSPEPAKILTASSPDELRGIADDQSASATDAVVHLLRSTGVLPTVPGSEGSQAPVKSLPAFDCGAAGKTFPIGPLNQPGSVSFESLPDYIGMLPAALGLSVAWINLTTLQGGVANLHSLGEIPGLLTAMKLGSGPIFAVTFGYVGTAAGALCGVKPTVAKVDGHKPTQVAGRTKPVS